MQRFATRAQQPCQPASTSRIPVEVLENRLLLSASAAIAPADVTDSPVAASTVNATAGKKFKDVIGSWTTADGLPKKGSGALAVASVYWGDAKSTRAKMVDDGSGVVQILGSHAWAAAGTFQIVVKVQEYPKGHPTTLTEIGEG